jgi:hypothetical protein
MTVGRPVLLEPRRSKAERGRRASFSGDMGRRVARIRGRSVVVVVVAPGLAVCFGEDASRVWVWLVLGELRGVVDEQSSCCEFGRDDGPSGERVGDF